MSGRSAPPTGVVAVPTRQPAPQCGDGKQSPLIPASRTLLAPATGKNSGDGEKGQGGGLGDKGYAMRGGEGVEHVLVGGVEGQELAGVGGVEVAGEVDEVADAYHAVAIEVALLPEAGGVEVAGQV